MCLLVYVIFICPDTGVYFAMHALWVSERYVCLVMHMLPVSERYILHFCHVHRFFYIIVFDVWLLKLM